MNALSKFMSDGDAEARAMLGQHAVLAAGGVQWAAATVLLAPAESELLYEAGGAQLRVKSTATVRKADLPRLVREGDSLTSGGVKYYVVSVRTADYDPLQYLTLAN